MEGIYLLVRTLVGIDRRCLLLQQKVGMQSQQTRIQSQQTILIIP